MYRRSEPFETELDDQRLFLRVPSADAGRWFVLDGTARSLWEVLERPADKDAIVRDLRERYTDDGRLESDVVEVLDEWCRLGLVTNG